MSQACNPTFQDKNGLVWDLSLYAPTLRKVKEVFGLGLVDLDGDPLNQLEADPEKLVDVIYLICKSQADARGLTSEQFGESLKPGLDEPVLALREAIINFFPAGKRSAVRSALEANAKAVEEALNQLTQRMCSKEQADKLIQAAVNRGVKEMDSILDRVTSNTGPT